MDRLRAPVILRRELGEVLEVSPAPVDRGARPRGGSAPVRRRGRRELGHPRDEALDARLRRLGVVRR
jgi:hypothetical protein